MRQPLVSFFAALCAGLTLSSPSFAGDVGAATIKMTVTSHDQEAVHAVALELSAKGQIDLAITTIDPNLAAATKADPRTTVSVSFVRNGVFSEAQVQRAQAQCRTYAERPGMSCKVETTYGNL